jgi:deoxyribodipyrimidine photolyase-related protein
MPKTLRLILGDQLNYQHSWFAENDSSITYLMLELRQETDYVPHHIQKVIAFFLSMRNFAEHLKTQGHQVNYFRLDHEDNTQDLEKMIMSLVKKYDFDQFEYQLPDEYRLDVQLKSISKNLDIPCRSVDSEHF